MTRIIKSIVLWLIGWIWRHYYQELCTFIRTTGNHIHANPYTKMEVFQNPDGN